MNLKNDMRHVFWSWRTDLHANDVGLLLQFPPTCDFNDINPAHLLTKTGETHWQTTLVFIVFSLSIMQNLWRRVDLSVVLMQLR